VFAVAFLYLCFTITVFLGSSILTVNHYPFFIAGTRFFGSGVILLSLYFAKHGPSAFHQLPQLVDVSFFKYAFCLYTISAIGFSWGMQYVDPTKACFVFVLSPFVTALLLYCLQGERLSLQKIYGLVIGFAAVIPIILSSSHAGGHSDVPAHLSVLGSIVFGCAVVSFAYGWILNKEMHQTIHVSPSLITGAALVVGGGTTLLFVLLFSRESVFAMKVTENFWWMLLLFSIITAVAYNLYSMLLKVYSATFISFASFLEPAFGLIYAALFLGHSVSLLSCLSLAGLGFGLYLFYQEELKV